MGSDLERVNGFEVGNALTGHAEARIWDVMAPQNGIGRRIIQLAVISYTRLLFMNTEIESHILWQQEPMTQLVKRDRDTS